MRYRVALPIVFGLTTAALMLWDLYNQRVVLSMGMAWDTGVPIWPYESAYLILAAINAPAVVLAAPLFSLPHLGLIVMQFPALFPAVLTWWWWVGTRFDFGLLGGTHYRRPRLWAGIALVAASLLVISGAGTIYDVVDRSMQRPEVHLLVLARWVVFAAWCFVLAAALVLAAYLFFKHPPVPPSNRQHHYPMLKAGVALTVLTACLTSVVGMILEPKVDRDSCVADEQSGCIHGTVLDEAGAPVRGVRIEILPAKDRNDEGLFSFHSEWSDSKGRFSANQIVPGEYIVAVHHNHAPDAPRPFVRAYYPGSEIEAQAEHIKIEPTAKAMLRPLSLRRIDLGRIDIEVLWADGTRPAQSNVLFENFQYPLEGVVGGEGHWVGEGAASLELPVGFDYSVEAQVDCDGGNGHEFRGSPAQPFPFRGSGPQRAFVKLVIPGPACPLWKY